MKTILLTHKINENKSYNEFEAVINIEWANFFNELNCLIVPVLFKDNTRQLFEKVKPDGVVLTGGNDLASVNSNRANSIRDQIDQAVFDQATKASIPIIGVCRGMQFIAAQFGFKIVSCNEQHVTKAHEIVWQSTLKSKVDLAFPKTVNSFHQYCVYGTNSDFNILATAKDGSIEAFEHRVLDCLGIMWHPERCVPFAKSDLELFSTFLKL